MTYQFDLKDIQTKEVSLVDRAANKRKFLLVKRKEGTMGGQSQGLGLEELRGQAEIPPPVLAAVIKMTQSAIEKLISLASDLEGMQKSGDDSADTKKQEGEKGTPLPEDIAKEFRAIMAILESVLQKYPSAAQKKDTNQDGKGDGHLENEELVKSLKELTEKLTGLNKKVEDLEKKAAEVPPPPPVVLPTPVVKGDQGTTDTKDEKEIITKALADSKEDIKKMLDTRGVELTKMFQDAAKEEFGTITKRVESIEKALTGNQDPNAGKGSDDAGYKRNFGMEEVDSKVTEETNPFVSMFGAMDNY